MADDGIGDDQNFSALGDSSLKDIIEVVLNPLFLDVPECVKPQHNGYHLLGIRLSGIAQCCVQDVFVRGSSCMRICSASGYVLAAASLSLSICAFSNPVRS